MPPEIKQLIIIENAQSKLKSNDSYDCCKTYLNNIGDDDMIPLSFNLGEDYSKVLLTNPNLYIYLNSDKITPNSLSDEMNFSVTYYLIGAISNKNTYYTFISKDDEYYQKLTLEKGRLCKKKKKNNILKEYSIYQKLKLEINDKNDSYVYDKKSIYNIYGIEPKTRSKLYFSIDNIILANQEMIFCNNWPRVNAILEFIECEDKNYLDKNTGEDRFKNLYEKKSASTLENEFYIKIKKTIKCILSLEHDTQDTKDTKQKTNTLEDSIQTVVTSVSECNTQNKVNMDLYIDKDKVKINNDTCIDKFTRNFSNTTKDCVLRKQNYGCIGLHRVLNGSIQPGFSKELYIELGFEEYKCYRIDGFSKGKFRENKGIICDFDHVREHCDGGNSEPSNCQALCPECHKIKTKILHKYRELNK